MDFVIIFGPQAVGKMTVGEELAKKTRLKLFHNHMTIDLLLTLFNYGDAKELINKFRDDIFKKMASLPNERGMIFTYVWAFELESEKNYIEYISNIFKDHNVYYVELNADLDTRLARNTTDNRLSKKWTKRDVKASEERLRDTMDKHRVTSYPNEVKYDQYIRIDNTNLQAEETAEKIVAHFNLERQ